MRDKNTVTRLDYFQVHLLENQERMMDDGALGFFKSKYQFVNTSNVPFPTDWKELRIYFSHFISPGARRGKRDFDYCINLGTYIHVM
jgi:hypothetical protein